MTPGVQGLLASLNEYQLRAAQVGPGPAAVIGTAGGGKTRVLEARIARMVSEGYPAGNILAMTFTNLAANELTTRLARLGVVGVRCGTIHAICRSIISSEQEGIDALAVDDGYRLEQALNGVLANMRKNRQIPNKGVSVSGIIKFVACCKATGLCVVFGNPYGTNTAAIERQRKLADDTWLEAMGLFSPDQAVKIYVELENRRAAMGLITYDDMLLWAWSLLFAYENIRKRWAALFPVIIVDEAQDSSLIQWDLSRMLAGCTSLLSDEEDAGAGIEKANLMIAGEPTQSIYSWRFAVPEAFVAFSKEEGVGVYTIPLNYRSVPEICAVASQLVENEEWHITGVVQHAAGEPCTAEGMDKAFSIKEYAQAFIEAQHVVTEAIELAQANGGVFKNICIMSRLSMFLHICEIECLRHKVPYVKRASGSFLDSREVLDILAYLRVAAGFDRDGKHMLRCIKAPFKYIGKRDLEAAASSHMVTGRGVLTALLEQARLSVRQRRSLHEMSEILSDTQDNIRAGMPPGEVVSGVIEDTRYLDYLRENRSDVAADSTKLGILMELEWLASLFDDTVAFLSYVDQLHESLRVQRKALKKKDDDVGDYLVLTTIHRCVHPSTLVETETDGLTYIGYAGAETGVVSTPNGPKEYSETFKYDDCALLKVVTEGGYTLTGTENHGMMAWNGEQYERTELNDLDVGMWLRLRLPVNLEEAATLLGPRAFNQAALPPLPKGRHNAAKYIVPEVCTPEVGELFGMLVADGTVYHSGFRFSKRYKSSCLRFSELCKKLFNRDSPVRRCTDSDMWICDVNSTVLSAWLSLIGGMEPNSKDVPTVIMQSGLAVRAAFISGLFEDGTVNIDDELYINHVSVSNKNEHVVRKVQVMLLQLGITCRTFPSAGQWRLDIYGLQAKLFGERVGFSCQEKQQQLEIGHCARTDRMRSVPISYNETANLKGLWNKQNGRLRGLLSRYMVEKEPTLKEKLKYHHVRIKEIKPLRGPAVCFEVPDGGRFLQNGFDGCNSKALEWDHVFIGDVVAGRFPWNLGHSFGEELRLMYVAVTRARKTVHLSCSKTEGDEESSLLKRIKTATKAVTGICNDGGIHESEEPEQLRSPE